MRSSSGTQLRTDCCGPHATRRTFGYPEPATTMPLRRDMHELPGGFSADGSLMLRSESAGELQDEGEGRPHTDGAVGVG